MMANVSHSLKPFEAVPRLKQKLRQDLDRQMADEKLKQAQCLGGFNYKVGLYNRYTPRKLGIYCIL